MKINFEKYAFAVLDVCNILHGSECGSGDPMSTGKTRELVSWLRWRVKNWDPPIGNKNGDYDYAVLGLARATLAMFNKD